MLMFFLHCEPQSPKDGVLGTKKMPNISRDSISYLVVEACHLVSSVSIVTTVPAYIYLLNPVL